MTIHSYQSERLCILASTGLLLTTIGHVPMRKFVPARAYSPISHMREGLYSLSQLLSQVMHQENQKIT
jgi:hypothetical protein